MFWKRLLSVSMVLLTAVLLTPTVYAENAWTARYFNNNDLSGNPVITRSEAEIDHNWGEDAPHEDVTADHFSVEWTSNQYFTAGTYRFSATTDDGMRVYIDNNKIIDSWYNSQSHTVVTDVFVGTGNHGLRVEYYNDGGVAVAGLDWWLASASSGNWQGEYFNNTSLSGSPVLVRNTPQINYNWTGSPGSGVFTDLFSVRWTSNLQLTSGQYRFTVTADDGVRLWVNNQLVIDQWHEQQATTYTADVTVAGGTVPVKMEYYENGGVAVAALNWTKTADTAPPSPAPQPAPISHWRGEYYNNIDLNGTPILVRDDSDIDFIWGSSSPLPNIVSADRFSVRWTQTLNLSAGHYVFTAYADDAVRLWVNGQQIINEWGIHNVQPFAGAINLPGGATTIVMEYYEFTGLAEARLEWTPGNSGGSSSGSSSPVTAVPGTAVMTGAIHLTVRSGPGLENEAVGYLSNGQVVTVLGRDAFTIWIKIQEADGTVGWVSGRFLSAGSPLSSLPILIE